MIEFTYKITLVNEELNQMEIEYSSPGRDTITVGTPLPLNNVTIEEFVQMYVPSGVWIQREYGYQVPAVGITGSYTPPVITAPTANT
jgi:hypothetical protein